jgi:DNA-binding transcriptional LysR family regulator
MRHRINLRQIEAFKAVIEHSTVSTAAAVLNISQPAMSKLIAHLEADAELRLFERVKGRLAPTELGMRLYDEIDRIFSGVQQVENAIDAIHRHSQGRLVIGVMPALSGSFVQQVVTAFLQLHPGTYCAIESRSSQWITESLVDRKLDIGFVSARMQNPYAVSEPLVEHPVVCIMPSDHPLAARRVIVPEDLAAIPFVSFDPESSTGQRIAAMFAAHAIRPRVALVANVSPTVCEFVAAGAGVSLVHPLMVSGFYDRLVVRPFEPATPLGFQLCHSRESRNARLIGDFIKVARVTAQRMLKEALVRTPRSPGVLRSSRPRAATGARSGQP